MQYLSFLGNMGGQELIIIFLVLLPMLLCLIALIQCLTANFTQATDRLVWVLVLLFLPILGPILWWTIGVGKTIR